MQSKMTCKTFCCCKQNLMKKKQASVNDYRKFINTYLSDSEMVRKKNLIGCKHSCAILSNPSPPPPPTHTQKNKIIVLIAIIGYLNNYNNSKADLKCKFNSNTGNKQTYY